MSPPGFGFGPGRAARRRVGASAPALIPGYGYDFNPANAAAFGGALPSDGSIGSAPLVFVNTSGAPVAQFDKSGANSAVYVSNAADGLPGVKPHASFGCAYRLLNASAPVDLYPAATAAWASTRYVKVSGMGNGSTAYFSYYGALGRIVIGKGSTETGTYNQGGSSPVQQNASVTSIPVPDTGVHVITFVTFITSYTGQSGSGWTLIYMDGACIGSANASCSGRGSTSDLILFDVAASGNAAPFVGTVMRDIIYPGVSHSPAQVRQNTAYLLQGHSRTVATKQLVVASNSLGAGVNGNGDSKRWNPIQQTGVLAGDDHGKYNNLSLGGANISQTLTEMLPLYNGLLAALGPSNAYLYIAEGHNELVIGGMTGAQAATNMRTFIEACIAAGWLADHIYVGTITGVKTTRGGFAQYPSYVAGLNALAALIPGIHIIDFSVDPNIGLAPDAATNAGYYGTTATGSNGAGANSDGLNGIMSGAAGVGGDGVHLTGRSGYVAGTPSTWSGYPRMADVYLKPVFPALLA